MGEVVMQRVLTPLPAASSGGCNRTVGSFVWATDSLIFYAAHRGIVVYDVDRRQSLATLLGHEGIVTCLDAVVLADRSGDWFWIVSGASDGVVMAWEVGVENGVCSSRVVSTVETVGPVTGVSCCRCCRGGGGWWGKNTGYDDDGQGGQRVGRELLVAVSSGDGGGAVRVLGLDGEGFRVRDTVQVGTLVECVCLVWNGDAGESLEEASFSSGSEGTCVLAGGFVDGSVRLWSVDIGDGGQLARSSPCVLRHQHQNWVRSIDIAWDAGRKRMVMATASQDRYVRVWSFRDDARGAGVRGLDAYAPKPHLRMGERTVAVVCEALLAGHEDWVHGARFWRAENGVLTLLTSSMDRTMMLWRREGDTGEMDGDGEMEGSTGIDDQGGSLWQSVSVVGDAGVNHLGYYTCAWRPDGRAIATHGHSGALHVWDARVVCHADRGGDDDDGDGGDNGDDHGAEDVYYEPRTPSCSFGHMGNVVDSSWSPDGTKLCTVSADQTCRLWGNPDGRCWREVGRPQVHGHDFSCVAFVSDDVYVSGSDEKVLRVFSDALKDERGARVRVKLPALGLSNVACQDNDGTGTDAKDGGATESDINNHHASITEEDLSQNTLWPEVRKLYGHGNDVYRVAADPKGRYVASASRAQERLSAAIIVWDTKNWTEVARNVGHDLTVTGIDCNSNGDLLATVGRDRKLIVWERMGDESDISSWRIRASKSKAHARVIWGCSWADESTLVTCARDGTISAWHVGAVPATGQPMSGDPVSGDHGSLEFDHTSESSAPTKLAETKLPSSVTAVAARGPLIAAGLESGDVAILVLKRSIDDGLTQENASQIEHVSSCDQRDKHAGAVRRIGFRPAGTGSSFLLSSVGDDGAVKFWHVNAP